MGTPVAVVGAGVMGLITAVRLQEAGFDVTVLSRDPPDRTTSAVAGAIWYPFHVQPAGRVLPWSLRTLEVLYDLADRGEAGVSVTSLRTLLDEPRPDPEWKDAVRGFRRLREGELPPSYTDGYVAGLPLMEAPRYLAWLAGRVEAAGRRIRIVPEGVGHLEEACGPGGIVVNCSGLGARELAGDDSLHPVRGQVVLVDNPGVRSGVVDEAGPLAITYVLPRGEDCVLGGTVETGIWSLEEDPATTRAILERARRLEPRLRTAGIRGVGVGLRPARPSVRLEAEPGGEGRTVIHNYGHGGAGFTLAWGCAEEVVALARAASASGTSPTGGP